LARSLSLRSNRAAASPKVSIRSCLLFVMNSNMEQVMSQKSDFSAEKSEMSSVEFVSYALRERVAPPSLGSVKARIRHASRALQWSATRTKDAWYADPRISISADELRTVEDKTGLRYAREELRTNDQLIARAEALLDGPEADFYRPFVAAFRAMASVFDRTGASRD
jgi:hypothetical protein